MNTIDELIKEIEPKLNERDQKIKERKELIKDVNDFVTLYPELEQVIRDLEAKYAETNDVNVKQELDSYIKEREAYHEIIASFTKQAEEIKKELSSVSEDFVNAEEAVTSYYYKRREPISELRSIEKRAEGALEGIISVTNEDGEKVSILEVDQENYQHYLSQLDEFNQKMQESYDYITNYDNLDYDDVVVEGYSPELPNYPLTKEEVANLNSEKEKILKDLYSIENSRGRKCIYKYTYQDVQKSVKIPKRLKGKYGSLLTELHNIDKQLKEYIPKVQFELDLYQSMSPDQQKSYLGNLMLQMQARADSSFNKYYINGKCIPYEYKNLYQEVSRYLKEHNPKKVHYYSYPIDWKKVEKLSIQERMDYFSELAYDYNQIALLNPTDTDVIDIALGGKTYKVKRDDEMAMRTCYEEFLKCETYLEEEKKRLIAENQKIEENSRNASQTEAIHSQGTAHTIDQNHVEEYIKNQAVILSIEDKLMDSEIYFDSVYYETLTDAEKPNYCQNILNQIFMKPVENSVELFADGKKVVIDSKYSYPFTMATSALVKIKNNTVKKSSINIAIDEDYVATLNDNMKIAYYACLMRDICNQPCENPVYYSLENQNFVFDKKYEALFQEVANRYMNLLSSLRSYEKVEKHRKAFDLKKIKKMLKKKATQILIGLGAMASVFTLGFVVGKGKAVSNNAQNIESFVNQANEEDLEDLISMNSEPISQIATPSETQSVEVEHLEDENPTWSFGDVFTLNHEDGKTASIYEESSLKEPLKPTYAYDDYTLVSMYFMMPNGEVKAVQKNDENANEKIASIEAENGVLQAVSAVSKSGEEDYAKNGIPTGFFNVNDILKSSESTNLSAEIMNLMNQSQGRGR